MAGRAVALRNHEMSATGGFSRDRRVRRRSEFQQVFERGTRLSSRFFTLLALPNGRSAHRLGIVASKKLGGAVERNRAKRLIREMFRRHVEGRSGPPVDAVVIPRRELLTAEFTAVTRDFQGLWRRSGDRAAAHARG